MATWLALVGALTTGLLWSGPAVAQTKAQKDQARTYFDAGAEAFAAGEYQVAADAFLAADALYPNPALHFSAGQAYRRAYLIEPDPRLLRAAVDNYRTYLADDPSGKRRDDALVALETLAPVLTRLELDQEEPPPPPPSRATRLLLTSPVADATMALDGGPFISAPRVLEVVAGQHRVVVRAPGYEERAVDVVAISEELVPQHIALEPIDALLTVDGPRGAEVWVDGQYRASLPSSPLPVEPGPHYVAVGAAGRESFGLDVTLSRAERRTLDAPLPLTEQRIAAWSTLAVGAGGAVATGVLLGLSLDLEADAIALRDARDQGNASAVDLAEYRRAAAARDDLVLATGVAGGVTGALLLTSVALFAFDGPSILPVPPREMEDEADAPQLTVGMGALRIRGQF